MFTVGALLIGLGLDKRELVGTSAWFYLAVNLAKVPVYVALVLSFAGAVKLLLP